jgi:hypothetical protein
MLVILLERIVHAGYKSTTHCELTWDYQDIIERHGDRDMVSWKIRAHLPDD